MVATAIAIIFGSVLMWRNGLRERPQGKREKGIYIRLNSPELIVGRDAYMGDVDKPHRVIRVVMPVALVYAAISSVLYVFAVPSLAFYMVLRLMVLKMGNLFGIRKTER